MTNIIALPDNIIKAIQKPLPPEAVSPHPTLKFLDTINAAYIMERLDDCFGIGGWHIEDNGITWIEDKNGKNFACTKVTLTITEYNLSFNAYGGSNNTDPGDMMKGAVTDGFTSCCKQLGIGRHVWMDKKGVPPTTYKRAETPAPAAKPAQPASPPVKAPDNVKLATEFLSNLVIGTIGDLNSALVSAKKSELSKGVKEAVWIMLKGHASRLKATYDESEAQFVPAKAPA